MEIILIPTEETSFTKTRTLLHYVEKETFGEQNVYLNFELYIYICVSPGHLQYRDCQQTRYHQVVVGP